MDAVFYLLDALRLSRGKALEEIREIAFEIGMIGRHGQDINDPQETNVLRAMLGFVFWILKKLLGDSGEGSNLFSGYQFI